MTHVSEPPAKGRPQPPPEGELISAALKKAGISVREGARRVGISEGWWRQIVKGYQSLSGGGHGPVRGPADTVARMAQVAGVAPTELITAGRPDAAQELDKLLGKELEEAAAAADELAVERRYDDPGLQAIWDITELPEHERRLAINAIQLWRGDLGSGEVQQRLTGT